MPDITTDRSGAAALHGKYDLGKLLGVGAFGKVYHARNILTGQSVAIKSLSKQKLVKGSLTAHITREIAIMRRLRNPNVVSLHEVMATKTKIYFVMELAKGGELFTKIAKGRFGEDLSRRFFQQLISAVGYCHSRGVFHRDLKPENLLLDENWDLKVSDFGLSALNDQIRPDGMLHTFCGTPAYVAPEVLAKEGYDGAKVDVWSCGVILFVLNAGYLPFNDANLMSMYRKIYKGEFRCPKWTSPGLRRLLSRLLDTNPKTRITIDEILHDPWFKKGYEKKKFEAEEFNWKGDDSQYMNAFDLISYSSGFDISGLLGDSETETVWSDRFVSAETPKRILDMVEDVARKAGVTVVRKEELGAKLEGHKGNFIVMVEIHRLTEKLVMVETRKKDRNVSAPSQEVWENTLRPQLNSLVYQPLPVTVISVA